MTHSLSKTETSELNFNTQMPTHLFVLLSLGTFGFYYFYWIYTTTNKINRIISQNINFSLKYILIFIGCWYWVDGFPNLLQSIFDALYFPNENNNGFEVLVYLSRWLNCTQIVSYINVILSICLLIFSIIFFISLGDFYKEFVLQNLNKNINYIKWKSGIFQGFYLYYIIKISAVK
jgi:hypothetical protein